MPALITNQNLDEQLWPSVATAMSDVLLSCNMPHQSQGFEIISASAGFIYDRKGERTVDLLGRPRNRTYSSPADDLLLALAVTFPSHVTSPGVRNLRAAADAHAAAKLDAEIAEAKTQAVAAKARLDQLTALRNQLTQ